MADQDQFVTMYIDTEDAFATANANDTSAIGLAAIKGSVTPAFEREGLEEDSVVMDHGMWTPVEGSSAGSTFNFSTRVGGLGDITLTPDGDEGAEDGETPTRTALGMLLFSLFGGEQIVAGDVVGPSATVASFELTTQGPTAGGGSNLTASCPVVLLVECVGIGLQPIPCTIAAGVCTPLMQPAAAPISDTGLIYGSLTYYLVEGLATSDPTGSFQPRFISDTTGHKYRGLGAMITKMVMNLSAKNLGKFDFEAMVNGWTINTDALAAVDPASSRPWMDATFRLAETGTITYAAGQIHKCKGDLVFDFVRGLNPEDDPNSTEGSSGYEENFSEPFFKFSPILPYAANTWRDDFGANVAKAWHALIASTRQPGRGCGVYASRMVQSAYPQKVEHNGMVRIQPEFSLGSGYTNNGVIISIY